ncbi:MAG: PQQ-binding-like beta-propeller repeat protein [Planctomycetes bacterium]|nr:PQQ-binding-like beta-propeller repeat protein [Planctomycetota bacterium]MBL7037969.1 PQQ-binding-like beta-propeller repeat protein [Pirellulaceae bacterium]
MVLPIRFSLAVIVGLWLTVAMLSGVGFARAEESAAAGEARQVCSRLGCDRGVCVLLDANPGELAVALARQSELLIYLQLPSDEATDAARARADAAGLLGTKIYVEKGRWSQIHLADNLADAVVVTPAAVPLARSCRDELLRVVNPLGKVVLGGEVLQKPYPDGSDDWSHPYHGPDNNPQSADQLARAPYLTQFLAQPRYVPQPEVTVASAGRIFKAFGHITFHSREWPWLNTLAAFNGYNGTLLWKRPLEPGFMIHRNTMIATPEVLYLGDNDSCELIDTATGKQMGEIVAPEGSAGLAWKWMALEGGILYALVGKQEPRDPVVREDWNRGGWPWRPLSRGYDADAFPWGFGQTFLAVNPQTRQIVWVHNETETIDGRAVCMKNGRIYYCAHGKLVGCLDAKLGKPAWRTTDAKLLDEIGPHFRAQHPRYGYSSSSYIKCSDQAVYFAGPQRNRLVAVSSTDGRLLWSYPSGNYHLVLRDDGLYAIGSTHGSGKSLKFDPISGRVLAELPRVRGHCTRATGSIDSIFSRGLRHAGTMRTTIAEHHPQRISLMRPPCQDGVVIANGMLHWGPWMCTCNLSLVGNIGLAPAGDFPSDAAASETERLESHIETGQTIEPLAVRPGDWPTYRADNQRSGAVGVEIPSDVRLAWKYQPPGPLDPAAPITAGGLVFLSGSDGAVRALDSQDGKPRWTAYTGGPIAYPPAIGEGRLFVGSGDGWLYAFEAASGRLLWRFRCAPAERKIHCYGRLSSTWPVASGVLVDRGVVYAAAGIANYDGTHVYALDAATGAIRWQNNGSGRLGGVDQSLGVSVQGHLLLHQDRLYLAGGNVVSPAAYQIEDGRCLNAPGDEWDTKAPRGSELFVVDGKVSAFDQSLYAPKKYHPASYFALDFRQVNSGNVIIRSTGGKIARMDPNTTNEQKKNLWISEGFERVAAMALGKNAVVVAGRLPSSDPADLSRHALAALAVEDGRTIWSRSLPSMPGSWTLAVDSVGRIIVALRDGQVRCFAPTD